MSAAVVARLQWGRLSRLGQLLLFVFLALFFAQSLQAQSASEPEPYRNIDMFGVDLATGTFNFSMNEMPGGSASTGIDVTRVWGKSGGRTHMPGT